MKVNIEDLPEVTSRIVEEYSDYRIFALTGEMGVGKTTFTKAFCTALGVDNEVNSPTFAIANIYDSANFGEIYHFDFYRLNNRREALDIGLFEYLDSGNYCLMEWPDIIIDDIPLPYVEIKIQHTDDNNVRDISTTLVS